MLAHAIAGEVGHGQVAKAINNLMLWITSIGLIEAGRIAESTGIAAAAFPRMCGTVHKAIGCLTLGRVFSDVRSRAQLERMETQMSDPAHLRAKAQLCSAIAELMSNPADANMARQTAEQYASLAEKAERERAGQQGIAMRSAGKASG